MDIFYNVISFVSICFELFLASAHTDAFNDPNTKNEPQHSECVQCALYTEYISISYPSEFEKQQMRQR